MAEFFERLFSMVAIKKAKTENTPFTTKVPAYLTCWKMDMIFYANGVNKQGKRTRAFPHWKQANDKAQGLVAEIKKRLEANK